MTTREFQLWQGFHAARFPNWAAWLKNLAKPESAVKQADVNSAMYETLADVAFVDAKEASKRLATGEEPEIDQFDQHARAVRSVAKKLRSHRIEENGSRIKMINGEPTYHCPHCKDVGLRSVWHHVTVKLARKSPELLTSGAHFAYTMSVACVCGRGCTFKANGMRQIDDTMFEVPDSLDRVKRLQALIEAVAALGGQTKQYDFGEYSA